MLLRNWLGGFFARDMELLKWGSLTDVGESFPHTQALSPLGDCPLRCACQVSVLYMVYRLSYSGANKRGPVESTSGRIIKVNTDP